MAPAPGGTAPGFFGKVRSHGDFVCRRLPPSFVTPWDRWLQAGLLRSRHDLGDAWLAAWLRAPIWRFQLAAGVCGADGWCGVLMPSLDCVGRYFPLTIAAPLVAGSAGAAWPDCFAAFEALALGALDEDFELSRFDAQQAPATGPPPAAVTSSRIHSCGRACRRRQASRRCCAPMVLRYCLSDTRSKLRQKIGCRSIRTRPCLTGLNGQPHALTPSPRGAHFFNPPIPRKPPPAPSYCPAPHSASPSRSGWR